MERLPIIHSRFLARRRVEGRERGMDGGGRKGKRVRFHSIAILCHFAFLIHMVQSRKLIVATLRYNSNSISDIDNPSRGKVTCAQQTRGKIDEFTLTNQRQ